MAEDIQYIRRSQNWAQIIVIVIASLS